MAPKQNWDQLCLTGIVLARLSHVIVESPPQRWFVALLPFPLPAVIRPLEGRGNVEQCRFVCCFADVAELIAEVAIYM